MKIKNVRANNKKRAFEVRTTRGEFEFPYSRLRLKPSKKDPIALVFPDSEIGYDGFTYQLASGREDTVVSDQLLEYAHDPEYLRKVLLFKLTLKAQSRIKKLGISKREVIRRMGTTPTQFYRLLDQRNAGKTIDQMVKLLAALDCPVDLVFAA